MNAFTLFRASAGLFCGLFLLLGASPATPTSMYLRVPHERATASVTKLSYDAIATVPRSASIPASLLPPDRVEATLVVAGGATGPLANRGRRAIPLVTVVETSSDGKVIRRTMFRDVTISSVRPMQTADGSDELRVRFNAASVVTEPGIVATAN